MQSNRTEAPGEHDQTAEGMRLLLRDLVELAGQTDDSHAAPVLELRFGDVVTRTTVSRTGPVSCLSIIAQLPRSEQLNFEASLSPSPANGPDDGTEMLWHADEGCYLMMRNIPVMQFPDEPSVMDAILDTSDNAQLWFAEACAKQSR